MDEGTQEETAVDGEIRTRCLDVAPRDHRTKLPTNACIDDRNPVKILKKKGTHKVL